MDTSKFQQKSMISSDTDEDRNLLKLMAVEAEKYLSGFTWCPPIKETYLAGGVGGIIGIFLIELANKIHGKDKYLWVVVGDLPSAYFVVDEVETPRAAMETYCKLMSEWVHAVNTDQSVADQYPIRVEPTIDNAAKLNTRLKFLAEEIAPLLA